ncbi:MAG: FecR domain-containing protein [Pseudomonadota bacterium]
MAEGGQSDQDRIDEAARDWFLRLSERDVTQRERHAFRAWLRADRAHAAAYAEIEATMGDFSVAFKKRPRRWQAVAIAAAACLAIAAGPEVLLRLEADHVTGTGSHQRVTLPDGAVAHLNTASALAVRYGADRREVALLRGEAVFEVVADPARPFVVVAAGGEAVATGTTYGVRIGDMVTVSVLEGSVSVSSAGQRRALAAGTVSDYADGAAPGPSRSGAATAFAWRDGFIAFDDETTLSQAAREIDRYLPGVTIVTGDVARVPVAGQLSLDSLEDGLEAIAATGGATVVRMSPYLRLIR